MSEDQFLSEATIAVARLYVDAIASQEVAEDMGVSVELAVGLVLSRLIEIPDYIKLAPDGGGIDVTALVVPALLLLSATTKHDFGVAELRMLIDQWETDHEGDSIP